MDLWNAVGLGFFALMACTLCTIEAGLLRQYPLTALFGLGVLYCGFIATLIFTYDPYDWVPFEVSKNQRSSQHRKGQRAGLNSGGGGAVQRARNGGTKKQIVAQGGGGEGGGAAGVGNGARDGAGSPVRKRAKSAMNSGGPAPGERIKDCDVCPELVVIPPGSVMLGSPTGEPGRQAIEGPRHQVIFKKRFAISRFEIRRDEYRAFTTATGYEPRADCRSGDPGIEAAGFDRPGFELSDNQPAVCLTRVDLLHYLAWLKKKSGHAYRLPSASQWEYAARGGARAAYSFGPEIGPSLAHYGAKTSASMSAGPRPVGSYDANTFGMHDVHGNVAEWVEDCWHHDLREAPQNGVALSVGYRCKARIIKDGAWYEDPEVMRLAARRKHDASVADNGIGFRVVRDLW